jgi:hypothetical protein
MGSWDTALRVAAGGGCGRCRYRYRYRCSLRISEVVVCRGTLYRTGQQQPTGPAVRPIAVTGREWTRSVAVVV